MTDGLYGKYCVFKSKDVSVNKLGGFEARQPLTDCFVLRPEKDGAARAAVLHYAMACEQDSPQLASELREWIAKLEAEDGL